MFHHAYRAKGAHKRRNAVDDLADVGLACPQDFLGAFPIIDVAHQVEPTKDAPVAIEQGQAENIEPAVDAIRAAVAALDVVRTTGFESVLQRGNRVLKVVRMN